METVFRNPLYNFIFDKDNHILIFEWTDATAVMSDDDFIEALSNFAGFAFEFSGPGLIVDVRSFQHTIGSEASKWRNEVALLRYLEAGSDRMAYVLPEQALNSVPNGDVEIGDFTDHYFGSREDATDWLVM